MVIVKIVGGLGNQMFCYAYAKNLEAKGFQVKIDISAYETYTLHGGYQLDRFNIDLQVATLEEISSFIKKGLFHKILRRLNLGQSLIKTEKSLLFDKSLLELESNAYVQGYFQSEQYFEGIRQALLNTYTLAENYTDYANQLKKEIVASENSCSIHVRRGDFLNAQNSSVHGTCSLDFYQQAFSYLNSKYQNLHVYVFSDDIEWCKQNLEFENIHFVDNKNGTPHEDMLLMSLCKHNVISNSTFSWWAAWLNENDAKTVIAPKRWFVSSEMQLQAVDICPKSWVRL